MVDILCVIQVEPSDDAPLSLYMVVFNTQYVDDVRRLPDFKPAEGCQYSRHYPSTTCTSKATERLLLSCDLYSVCRSAGEAAPSPHHISYHLPMSIL